jgi:hypothetical protein
MVLYLTIKGLPSAVVRLIEPHLQFSGMVLTLEKIKLSVFEGIVATSVKYYKIGDIGQPIVQADRVVLKMSPMAWFRGESGISGVIIKNGMAVFSPPGEAACKIVLDNIYADVLFDHKSKLQVLSFSASAWGLKVSGQGVFVIPPETIVTLEKKETTPAGLAEAAVNKATLQQLPEMIKTFASSNAVSLNVDFFVNPDQPETLAVKANIHGRKTVFAKSSLEVWTVNAVINGKTATGNFALTGADLEQVPVQTLNGNLRFSENGMLNVSVNSIVGRTFKAGPLDLTLNYDTVSNKFDGFITAGCDPRSFVPVLRTLKLKLADIFRDFDFKRSPPLSEIVFNGEAYPAFFCRLTGTVLADTYSYKKVTGLLVKVGFDAALDEEGEKVSIQPLLIVRDEGMVRGQFVYDSDGEIITFSGMSMTDPKATAQMIDQDLVAVLIPYSFRGLCYITACGRVGCTNSIPNDMEMNFTANDVGWKILNFSSCALTLNVQERNYQIDDIDGVLCGGKVKGSVSVDPVVNSTNFLFTLNADADNVDFSSLLKSISGKELESDYAGTCSANLNLCGLTEDALCSSYRGNGWLKIENARIFTVPIFSGLFDVIGKVVPGLGKLAEKNRARAAFTVENGKVHSSNILIEGNVISLKGSGDVYFDGRLDFKVQVSFMNRQHLLGSLVQLVTMPIAKAFEFHLGGTLAEPEWKSSYWPF